MTRLGPVSSRIHWLRWAMGLALALVSNVSMGSPTAVDKETARMLFKEANALRKAGDFRAALERYRAAHALGQTPVTGLLLGQAHEQVGELVEAREVLLSIERIPVEPNESPRAREARDQAAVLASEVALRIPTLSLDFSECAAGTSIIATVDGIIVPEAALRLPRRVNPGTHVIETHVAQAISRRSVILNERDVVSVSVSPRATEPSHERMGAQPGALPEVQVPTVPSANVFNLTDIHGEREPTSATPARPEQPQRSQQEATPSRWGGYGSVAVTATRLTNTTAPFLHFEAGVSFDHVIVFGAEMAGIVPGLLNGSKYGPAPHSSSDGLTLQCFDAVGRYLFFARSKVSFGVGATVGIGLLKIRTTDGGASGDQDKVVDDVFVFTPQVGAYFHVLPWLNVAVLADYRLITDVDTRGLSGSALSGISLGGAVQAGKF